MAVRQLNLKALEDFDGGKAAMSFNGHLARIAADCMDRPGDTKARKVTLTFTVVPVISPDGTCDDVKAKFHIKSSVPDHCSKEYSLGMRRNGVLVFNEDSLDNIDQTTLLGDDD